MAAIIAQLTRANRERKKGRGIETSKCMYEISPFDERYYKSLVTLFSYVKCYHVMI